MGKDDSSDDSMKSVDSHRKRSKHSHYEKKNHRHKHYHDHKARSSHRYKDSKHEKHYSEHNKIKNHRRSRERSIEKPFKPNKIEEIQNKNILNQARPKTNIIESGMRSWIDTSPNPIQQEKLPELVDSENFRLNEIWVGADKNELKPSRKQDEDMVWQHDKFGEILIEYDNEERLKELKEKQAIERINKKDFRKRRPESPKWQHDKFERISRPKGSAYQYVVRLSPPTNQGD